MPGRNRPRDGALSPEIRRALSTALARAARLTHQVIPAILGSAERAGKPAALIFYLLFVVGVLVFAILPGLDAGPLKTALLRAALFGLIAYATYDLMNLATLKDWPMMVIVVDLAQGTVWASQ